jgi:hypothetical protein
MKILYASLLIFASFTTSLSAETSAGTYVMRPCDSWTYNFDVRAYVCNFTGPTIEVVTSDELQRLNDKIAELEAKIDQLEQRFLGSN